MDTDDKDKVKIINFNCISYNSMSFSGNEILI
jgi:hypothetical protein